MTDVLGGSKAARALIDHTEEAIDGSSEDEVATQVGPTCSPAGRVREGGWRSERTCSACRMWLP